jgi:two-component system response regulator FixJ
MTSHPPVFVVDDEEAVRVSLGRLLQAIGVPNRTFGSAQSFLEDFQGDEAGCLLLDLRMPGMSGVDLLEELERRGMRLPVIVMTGHTDMASSQRLAEFQPIGLLEKPFSVTQLRAMLDQWRANPG